MPNDPTTIEAELQRINGQLSGLRTEIYQRRSAPGILRIAVGVMLGIWLGIFSWTVISAFFGMLFMTVMLASCEQFAERMSRDLANPPGKSTAPKDPPGTYIYPGKKLEPEAPKTDAPKPGPAKPAPANPR